MTVYSYDTSMVLSTYGYCPWGPALHSWALTPPWHLKASHCLQAPSFWLSQSAVGHPWPLFPAGTLSTALPAAPSRLRSESLSSTKLPGSSPCLKARSTPTHLGLPAWISFSSLGGRLCYLGFQVLHSEALEFKHRPAWCCRSWLLTEPSCF